MAMNKLKWSLQSLRRKRLKIVSYVTVRIAAMYPSIFNASRIRLCTITLCCLCKKVATMSASFKMIYDGKKMYLMEIRYYSIAAYSVRL